MNETIDIFKKQFGKLVATVQSRNFAVISLTLSLAGIIFFVADNTNVIYINDDESVLEVRTLKENPHEILKDYGIVMMAHDTANFTGINDGIGEININRAFPVTIKVDGITSSFMVTDDMTVEMLLRKEKITLGTDDLISLPIKFFLSENDHIIIQRVETTTTVFTEEIPFEIEYTENSLLKLGKSETMVNGVNGLREITYVDRIVDGLLEEREVLSDVVTKNPITKKMLKGTNNPVQNPISNLDFGYKLGSDGKPIGYSYVLQNQVATGYSAKPGRNIGASRMKLFCGYAAVNPNVIPYGSKMYVTSPDNQFVYGYCIAADTGTGLMNGTIDIDLYYETYRESQLNSRRMVNIYVFPSK